MSRPKTVNVATSADWTFTQVPGVLEEIKLIAGRVARHRGVNSEDLEQDLLLHIAVRPKLAERDWEDEQEVDRFLSRAFLEANTLARDSTANDWRIEYLDSKRDEED